MKLIKLSGRFLSYLFVTACFVLVFSQINAQQVENQKKENKATEIIIIEETIDENGNKVINKKVLKGGDMSDEEIEKMIAREIGGTIDIKSKGNGEEEIMIVIEDEEDHQERGFLGLMGERGEGGVSIQSFTEGSAAEKAGLKTGDLVTALDDNSMTTLDDMIEYLADKKPGEEVVVRFVRDGDTSEATVSLGSKVKSNTFTLDFDNPNVKWKQDENEFILRHEDHEKHREHEGHDGAEGHDGHEGDIELSKENKFTFKSDTKPRLGVMIEASEDMGVKVLNVVEGSLAEQMDLREGDIITHFNGIETNDPKALVDAVQASPIDKKVKIEFLRDGSKVKKKLTFK